MEPSIFAQGFFLQASLILALGAQNIFVLNSGLRRQRHLLVAVVCSICDTALVFAGVLGVASLFVEFPYLKIGLGLTGVCFLMFYGLLKLKEAKIGVSFEQASTQITTVKQTVIVSLGFSLLNPHVYLDTVVLIGGYSTKFGKLVERFFFGAGAASFSIIWFFGLAFLASRTSRFLNNANAMRVVSLISGLILLILAFKLALEVKNFASI